MREIKTVLCFKHMDHATKDAFAALTTTVARGLVAVAEDIASVRGNIATLFGSPVMRFAGDIAPQPRCERSLGHEIAEIHRRVRRR